jgi:hypothetical protein
MGHHLFHYLIPNVSICIFITQLPTSSAYTRLQIFFVHDEPKLFNYSWKLSFANIWIDGIDPYICFNLCVHKATCLIYNMV